MAINLRRATIDDVPTLLEIEQATKGEKIYIGNFTAEEITRWITDEYVYLILENQSRIGSLSYEIREDDRAYISGLVIRPEHRKQGLAKQAMLLLLEQLTHHPGIDLVVHPANHPAINLYTSLGFSSGSTVDNYFGDGEPRIKMTKRNIL